ncbi:uncharacterized protein si:ch211-214p13.7 [Mugil cephalus]|uniref:uncharacterized protein si:ch211-214p13.7 n=1 Tax=Mugil cephalus TaxID=48193 RepID=UPI001FB67F6A|nr:uncharacterized protein si:ch211-214p13.7 [Mugil cephalus]
MGNCISRQKEKRKGDSDDKNTDNKADDVMYASINHTTAKVSRRTRATSDDDCDYATVNIPAADPPAVESECSSKEECADDYVLMG